MTDERKRAICRRFSRAAATYDDYALVQKESGDRLAASLPAPFSAGHILEIGCGTGNYTARLAARFPYARIVALDFSEAMIRQARRKCPPHPSLSFVCEEGERYLAGNRRQFDLITSNATMQWFDDLSVAFPHVARSLSPTGIFHASLFGPLTLRELAAALAAVYDASPALPAGQFPGRKRIGALLQACFGRVEVTEEVYRRSYLSVQDLFRHISKTGTGGHHSALPRLTRGRLQGLEEWFERHGGLALSYQVFFVTAALAGEGHR